MYDIVQQGQAKSYTGGVGWEGEKKGESKREGDRKRERERGREKGRDMMTATPSPAHSLYTDNTTYV